MVKAYAQADEVHVADRIDHALRATGYRSLCGVSISERNGSVTLSGRVPSYYLKQIAQSVAKGAPGVRDVRNDLEVIFVR